MESPVRWFQNVTWWLYRKLERFEFRLKKIRVLQFAVDSVWSHWLMAMMKTVLIWMMKCVFAYVWLDSKFWFAVNRGCGWRHCGLLWVYPLYNARVCWLNIRIVTITPERMGFHVTVKLNSWSESEYGDTITDRYKLVISLWLYKRVVSW